MRQGTHVSVSEEPWQQEVGVATIAFWLQTASSVNSPRNEIDMVLGSGTPRLGSNIWARGEYQSQWVA